MKKLNPFYLVVFMFLFSCGKEIKKEKQQNPTANIESNVAPVVKKETPLIATYDYNSLAPLLNKKGDKTYIVNFWATWCKPCVDELPAFEKINENFKDKNVEVLLVSLDFPNQVESQLLPFIKERNIKSEVVLFDDPNQNVWINKIDSTWTGALPATIIYTKDKRAFYEQSFDYDLLLKELQTFIK